MPRVDLDALPPIAGVATDHTRGDGFESWMLGQLEEVRHRTFSLPASPRARTCWRRTSFSCGVSRFCRSRSRRGFYCGDVVPSFKRTAHCTNTCEAYRTARRWPRTISAHDKQPDETNSSASIKFQPVACSVSCRRPMAYARLQCVRADGGREIERTACGRSPVCVEESKNCPTSNCVPRPIPLFFGASELSGRVPLSVSGIKRGFGLESVFQ